jgi:hypothetical protein
MRRPGRWCRPDAPSDAENRRYFLELAAGLWLHTRELLGKPTRGEARATLEAAHLWTARERELLMDSLVAGGEVA